MRSVPVGVGGVIWMESGDEHTQKEGEKKTYHLTLEMLTKSNMSCFDSNRFEESIGTSHEIC